jgi:hypothetical protein
MLFAIGSTFHILGFLWILLTIRNIRPLTLCENAASSTVISAKELP